MKITQNQNNNLLIIRFLCKFAHRTTVQILEGFRPTTNPADVKIGIEPLSRY